MLSHGTSPIQILVGIILAGCAIFFCLMLIPGLTVTPVPTADPRAAFGMLFNLKNSGVATLHEVTSTLCVNSVSIPGRKGPATDDIANHGNVNEVAGLSDLEHGDSVPIPFENSAPGPPGSKMDIVFVIRFQPGWWFWTEERRFRFDGTKTRDKSRDWVPMPLGSPCG